MPEYRDLSQVEAIQDFNEKLLRACMPQSFTAYPITAQENKNSGSKEEELKRIYKARIRPFLVTTYS